MATSSKKSIIRPVDLAIIGYLTDTFVLALFLPSKSLVIEALSARLIFFLIIAILFNLKSKFDNKLINLAQLFYPFILLAYIYGETHIFHNIFYNLNLDSWLANSDEFYFKSQPSIEFSKQIGSKIFADIMYFSYLSYYFIIFGSVYWVYKKLREKSDEFNFVIISSFTIYYLVFIFFPAQGPQYYFAEPSNIPPDSYLFGDILKLVQQIGERPTGAFPSSHVGITIIIVLTFPRKNGLIYFSILFLSLSILFSTVYIKAHYVVDVLAGLISAPALIFVSKKLYKLFDDFLTGFYHKWQR